MTFQTDTARDLWFALSHYLAQPEPTKETLKGYALAIMKLENAHDRRVLVRYLEATGGKPLEYYLFIEHFNRKK